MDFEQFRQEYVAARAHVDAGRPTDIASLQGELRGLADRLTDETDRRIAYRLIDRLKPVQTAPDRSPEMAEALYVLDSSDFESGPAEQRLAALRAARRQIWAIADRAGQDSIAIRALTRGLESTEKMLTEGMPWDEPTDSRA